MANSRKKASKKTSKPKRKSSILAAAALASAQPATASPDTQPNHLTNKMSAISNANRTVRSQTLWVDPAECRLWEYHDRDDSRLNQAFCQDLIDSFLANGGQKMPALVRRATDGGAQRYEIIAGARRYWTVNWLRENNYPQFEFLVQVVDCTDEEAFRLNLLENLDRKDVSDYERACNFAEALKTYYHDSQAEMAKRLEKTESWVSRFVAMAKLPEPIINAYPSIHDLKVTHASELLKLVTNAATSEKVLSEAKNLHAEHQTRSRESSKAMSGAEVLKRLKLAAASKKGRGGDRGPVKQYGPKGAVHLTLKSVNRNGLSIVVPTTATEVDVITESFRKCLQEYLKG